MTGAEGIILLLVVALAAIGLDLLVLGAGVALAEPLELSVPRPWP